MGKVPVVLGLFENLGDALAGGHLGALVRDHIDSREASPQLLHKRLVAGPTEFDLTWGLKTPNGHVSDQPSNAGGTLFSCKATKPLEIMQTTDGRRTTEP